MANKKFVVYTALFGDYDQIRDPDEEFENCDFICFTDQQDLHSTIWKFHYVKSDLPCLMMNRKFKLLPHLFLKDYKSSLYIDANIKLIGNPIDLHEKYLTRGDIAAPKHFLRECLYQEGKACIASRKSSFITTLKQINHYAKNLYPINNGLTENNILLRRHNEVDVIKFMKAWYNELNRWTMRDQLSFSYIAWKERIPYGYMDEDARHKNKYFKYFPHKKETPASILDKILDKYVLDLIIFYIIKKNGLHSMKDSYCEKR